MGFGGGARGSPSRGGFGGGRGGFRGGAGGRGGGRGPREPMGPPQEIRVAGKILHVCEEDLVAEISGLDEEVPFFSGRVFLENKSEIGRIDEILGPLNHMHVSIRMAPGVKATSIPVDTKIYIDAAQILPLARFLPKPAVIKGEKPKGSPAGSSRGGGGFRGRGRGAPRGGARGGFSRGGGRGGQRGGAGFRGGNRGGFQSRA